MRQENKDYIINAIKARISFPVKAMRLYKSEMPFTERTFHRGLVELANEGKIRIKSKGLGRGRGIHVFITSAKKELL